MGDRFSHLNLDEKERSLAAHLSDLARIADERGIPRFSSFLDEREQKIAACAAAGVCCRPYGGFADAQRCIYGFAPSADWLSDEAYPLKAVTVRWRRQDTVGHRDLLGAVMALQLKRETVGDLLLGEGEAVLFALPTAADLIVRELSRAGNVGVSCLLFRPEVLPEVKTEALEGVAASLRLDCIVAALTKQSRSESAALIHSGKVACTGQIITQPSFLIAEGEKIAVHGFGKFVFRSVGAQTRSGRVHIFYEKYL